MLLRNLLAALFALPLLGAAAAPGSSGPMPPVEAASSMKLPEGFHATLFAGEPDVVQPIATAFDDRGRLWCIENFSYPHWLPPGSKEGRDRIVIFDDPDGTGKFRSKKVFLDNGVNLSGIELGFDGVWLCSSPYLIFIPMRDGEDKPAGPAQILLDGWNIKDSQHNVFNRLTWAPDGWLWGCNGILSKSGIGKPGTPDDQRTPIDCGVWRYHPTRHIFEVVANGTTNPWGLDFDDMGQAFITNCVIAHLWHVLPGAHYQRMGGNDFNLNTFSLMATCADHIHWGGGNWQTSRGGLGEHSLAGGGHAHAGAMVYLGDNWPDAMRDSIFMCNIHGARVNHDILAPRGSGYVGHHGPDFMFAADPWFRGLDLHYGPDGGVFITDWSDTGECHNHIQIDQSNGRIYKVVYGSAAPRTDLATLDVAALPDAELVKLQLHKNDWFVRHARRVLQERAAQGKLDPATVPALLGMLHDNPDLSRKLRALWTLNALGAASEPLLLEQLRAPEPYLRAWAAQLLAEAQIPGDAALAQLAAISKSDPSPVVRLHLASMLQRVPVEKRWPMLEGLASHSEDAADANLPLMDWYAIEPAAGADPQRAGRLIETAKIPLLREYTARRMAPTSLATLMPVLEQSSDAGLDADVLRGIEAAYHDSAEIPAPPAWGDVHARLEKSGDPFVRQKARQLTLLFGDRSVLPILRRVLSDPAADAGERLDAMHSLSQVKDAELPALLDRLLDDPAVRLAALQIMPAFWDDRSAQTILDRYASFDDPAKRSALIALTSRPASALKLLDAIEANHIPRADISVFVSRQMANLGDDAVTKKLTALFGAIRPTSKDKLARIAEFTKRYSPDVIHSGDRPHGRVIFSRSCGLCHTLFDAGGTLAPNLTGAQRGNLEYILAKVFDPSATVPKDYQTTVVQKKDGSVVSGIIGTETPQTLILKTPTGPIVVSISDIARRKTQPVSMMPEGLLDGLSTTDTRDLLSYLQGPDQVAMPLK